MNSILKYIAFIGLLIVFSCSSKNDCRNVELDDQTLDTESKEYDCYEDIIVIIFIDEDGNEHQYLNLNSESKNRPYVHYNRCGTRIKEAKYNGEYVHRTFEGPDSTMIWFDLTTTFIEGEEDFHEENLIDLLTIKTFEGNIPTIIDNEQFEMITSSKDGVIDKSIFNDIRVNYIENIEIQGKNFNSVYEEIDANNNPILFSKTKGVISFKNKNDKLLIFDKMQ